MSLSLDQLGERVFSFALMFSIIATIIVITLAAAGADLSSLNLPLLAPASFFFSAVQNIVSRIPQQASIIDLFAAATFSLVGSVLEFSLLLLFGILLLVQSLASIVPPEVRYLVVPLYFIGSFLQFTVWYYLVVKIFASLKSWITPWS